MSDGLSTGGIPAGEAIALAELVEFGEGAVVSRALKASKAGTLTLFAFDRGRELSEHSAPFDACLNVVEGEAPLTIGGEEVAAKSGEIVSMPADIPHAVGAVTRVKMLLVMIKEPKEH